MNIEITIDGRIFIAVPKEEQTLKTETWPQNGDRYEFIESDGYVIPVVWQNTAIDHACKAIGNVYRVGEAQKALDKLKAWARINDYIDANGLRFDESNGLDWKDTSQPKWFWRYDHEDATLTRTCYGRNQFSDNPVFRTADDLQKVIDACMNDILIVMGV